MLAILILLILSIVFLSFSNHIFDQFEELGYITFILGIFIFVAFMLAIGYAVFTNITKDATVASLQTERQSLVYQLENIDTLYGNSRANDKKELFNQIQKWNSNVASGKILHNSLWTNWFEPVDWEKIGYIEVKIG